VVSIGVPPTTGYTYQWTPTSGLSSGTISNPVITHLNTSGQNDTLTYILTVSLGSCSSQDTVQVIVKPSPVSNAGPDQLVCGSGTLQLGTSTTTGYIYTWTPPTDLSSTTISDPILTYNNSGTTPDTLVYVVTTDLNGCVTSDTVQIINSPAPTAIAGPDTAFCSGSSVMIGSGSLANYVYTWIPSTGLSSSTISDPVVTLTNLTTVNDTVYYILTTDLFGCTDSDTLMIIVKPNPIANAGSDVTLCSGDTVQIGTTATTGYIYSWTPPGGLSSTTVSDPLAIVSNSGGTPISVTYTVTVNLNGCISTDSVTITVNPQPNVTATANPTSICIGDSAILTATGATSYSWALSTSPGNPISTSSTFVVYPTVTTTYILTGTNSFSCSNTNTVTVTVNPLPVVQISALNDTICNGDTLTLTATGATSYTWSVLGGATIGTGPSVQVFPITATTYVVIGTNGNSCSNSDTISVVVNPAATITAITGTTSVCPGVTGVQYWVINPDPNSTYIWSVTNGTIASGQGTDTITVDWSTTSGIGTVTVIEQTNLGCHSLPITLQVTINVFLTPVAPTGPTSFCANEALGVYTTLNTSGSIYIWTAQGGTIVSGDSTSIVTVDWNVLGPQVVALWYQEISFTSVDTCYGISDTLYVTINPAPVTGAISGPSGICVNDTGSYSVANTASSTYNWSVSPGTIVTGNGTNNITVNWTSSGTAILTVIETNSYGCKDTVTLQVTINALPSVNAGSDVGVCIGQGTLLTALGANNYTWSILGGSTIGTGGSIQVSPTTLTTYVVLGTDANGCKNTDTVTVTVNPLPVITLTPNSSVCIGNSIQLTANGGNSYQWSPTGTLNDPNIFNPVAAPTTTTIYTVIVTDQNTCVDSASVTITVNPLPTITASVNTDTICAGSTANLSANGGVSFSWNPIPTPDLNNGNVQNPVATPSSPGNTTYTVTGTDANGCSNSAQVTVNVHVQPEASFTVNDANLDSLTCFGYTAVLHNTSDNSLTYLWTFPNGSTSTVENPEVQLNLSGSNIITLVAINNMCRDTTVDDFTSTAIEQLFSKLPNIFTPNGDGKNECFDLGLNIDLKECSDWVVYNRWGEKVFTSSVGQSCWNGTVNNTGKVVPEGTYFVVVIISGQSYKGSITVLRK
jgi:gliding motility-associated-like protein